MRGAERRGKPYSPARAIFTLGFAGTTYRLYKGPGTHPSRYIHRGDSHSVTRWPSPRCRAVW